MTRKNRDTRWTDSPLLVPLCAPRIAHELACHWIKLSAASGQRYFLNGIFQVPRAAICQDTVFWEMTPCTLADMYHRFGGERCNYLHGSISIPHIKETCSTATLRYITLQYRTHIVFTSMFCMLLFNLCFVCVYLILYIMYFFCYAYVFLSCIFRSRCCVSLCCSVYCSCVNVNCTAASGCQPNCS